MKPAALLTTLLVLFAFTATSQLSLLPQLGFESAKTSINHNGSSFSPSGGIGNLKASLRLDYRFKGGHGPFIGIGNSPAVVEYSFADANNPKSNYTTSTGSKLFRMEAGYMYTSKAINLGKSKSSATKTTAQTTQQTTKQSCIKYYSCGSKSVAKKAEPAKKVNTNMRLQPSVGIAYTPGAENQMLTKSNGYTYIAGNYRTAVVSGMGFEFGKGKERIMTVTVHYAKGLGSNEEHTIITDPDVKPVVNTFKSSTSNWGLTFGIPISLNKAKKSSAKQQTQKTQQKQSCQPRVQSYNRCGKKI